MSDQVSYLSHQRYTVRPGCSTKKVTYPLIYGGRERLFLSIYWISCSEHQRIHQTRKSKLSSQLDFQALQQRPLCKREQRIGGKCGFHVITFKRLPHFLICLPYLHPCVALNLPMREVKGLRAVCMLNNPCIHVVNNHKIMSTLCKNS